MADKGSARGASRKGGKANKGGESLKEEEAPSLGSGKKAFAQMVRQRVSKGTNGRLSVSGNLLHLLAPPRQRDVGDLDDDENETKTSARRKPRRTASTASGSRKKRTSDGDDAQPTGRRRASSVGAKAKTRKKRGSDVSGGNGRASLEAAQRIVNTVDTGTGPLFWDAGTYDSEFLRTSSVYGNGTGALSSPLEFMHRPPSRAGDGQRRPSETWDLIDPAALDMSGGGRPPSRDGGIRPLEVTGWQPPSSSSSSSTPSAAESDDEEAPSYLPATGPLVRLRLCFEDIDFDAAFGSPPSDDKIAKFKADLLQSCGAASINPDSVKKIVVEPGVVAEVQGSRSSLEAIAQATGERRITALNGAVAKLASKGTRFFCDDRVLVPWSQDGYFYPATVVSVHDGSLDVLMEDDRVQHTAAADSVFLFDQDQPAVLRPGHYVLTNGKLRSRFEPAVVLEVKVQEGKDAQYNIAMVDGTDVVREQREVVKISETDFQHVNDGIRQAAQQAAEYLRQKAVRDAGVNKLTGAPTYERTTAMLLPSAVATGLVSTALSAATEAGMTVVLDKPTILSRSDADGLLGRFRSFPFYADLIAAATSGPCYAALLDGPDAIKNWLALVEDMHAALPRGSDAAPSHPILLGSPDPATCIQDMAMLFDPRDPPILGVGFHSSVAHGSNPDVDAYCTSLIGQSVLSRWLKDGWFYPVDIVGYLGGGVLLTEDADGSHDTAGYGTVLATRTLLRPEQEGDLVLCVHPRHMDSFAPGQLHQAFDGSLVVVFYDNTAIPLDTAADCFRLRDQRTYEDIVRYVNRAEAAWIGKHVLVRNDEDGLFYQGVVSDWMAEGVAHCYSVQLRSGHIVSIMDVHVHAVEHSHGLTHAVLPGDCVLAPYLQAEYDPQVQIFAPAKALSFQQAAMFVEFWDGKRASIHYNQCVWISEEYFDLVCAP